MAMKRRDPRCPGISWGEQSGHIADVGFDLYVRMVGEAPAEVKGEVDTESIEVLPSFRSDAHIPESYVPEERLRLGGLQSTTGRVAGGHQPRLLGIADRYGQFPAPVETALRGGPCPDHACSKGRALQLLMQDLESKLFSPVELPHPRIKAIHAPVPRDTKSPATEQHSQPLPVKVGKPLINRELIMGERNHRVRSETSQGVPVDLPSS